MLQHPVGDGDAHDGECERNWYHEDGANIFCGCVPGGQRGELRRSADHRRAQEQWGRPLERQRQQSGRCTAVGATRALPTRSLQCPRGRADRAAGHHEEGRRRHLARIFREPRCCLILEQFRGFAEFVRVGGRLVGLFFCRPGVLPPYPRCLSACRGQHYARFYGARARAAMRNTCFGPSPQRLRCGPPRLPCKVARAQAIKWAARSATVRATPWSCCAIASLDRIRRKLR